MISIILTITNPPILDWSATAAWLGIFATLAISIITPAITTYLNNKFQLRLKETELKYLHQKEFYLKKRETFEIFLNEFGCLINCEDLQNHPIPMQHLYQLYFYLSPKHWELVDGIINSASCDSQDYFKYELKKLCKVLADELNNCESEPNLKKQRSPRKNLTNN